MDLKKEIALQQALLTFSFLQDVRDLQNLNVVDRSKPGVIESKFKVILSSNPEAGYVDATMFCHFDDENKVSDLYVVEHLNGNRIGKYRKPEDLENSMEDLIKRAAIR